MLPSIEWWIEMNLTERLIKRIIFPSIFFSQTLSKNFWNPLHPLILLLFSRTFVSIHVVKCQINDDETMIMASMEQKNTMNLEVNIQEKRLILHE